MAEVLSELSEGKIIKGELQSCECTAKSTVRDLFWLSMGFSPETKWPKQCKEPETLRQCCKIAHEHSGS
eukprot:542181-Amphidinium_carterae.1